MTAVRKRAVKSDERPAVPSTVAAYVAAAPAELRPRLERLRRTILRAAPGARERISYQMPAYALEPGGIVAWFGVFRGHVGFYPPVREAALAAAAAAYSGPKGNLRFPHDEPIPYGLVTKIVKSRVREAEKKRAAGVRASRKPAKRR